MARITAGDVLDIARSRHPLFSPPVVSDGVLLNAMSARQRTLLLMHGGAIEGLVSTTVDLAIRSNGLLVGVLDGVPIVGTQYADGWPTHLTDDGVPYVDFAEVPIAGDPFGEHGGTPGFPLPDDFVKLIAAAAIATNACQTRVNVIAEAERFAIPRTGLTAFVSGNRLVPLRQLARGNNDAWSGDIATIELSYVVLPVLTRLADPVTLPAPLHEALIAGMAETIAFGTPTLSPADRSFFAAYARQAEAAADAFSVSMLDTAQLTSVQFRG